MKVKKVLQNAPVGAFYNTFDLHYVIIGLETHFFAIFESDRFTQVLLYTIQLQTLHMCTHFLIYYKCSHYVEVVVSMYSGFDSQ